MDNNRRIFRPGRPDADKESFVHQKEVRKQSLINRLNYVNFQDDTILVTFRHTIHHHRISLKVKPQPCLGEELACTWPKSEKGKLSRLKSYTFEDIKILNGRLMTVIKPVDFHISEKGIHVLLPETGKEVSSRKTKRYACNGISAQLIQHGVSFSGKMIDFSSVSFHLELSETVYNSFFWIDPDARVTLLLSNDRDMLYAGECDILKRGADLQKRNFVLTPSNEHLRRFKPKDFRAVRQRFDPGSLSLFQTSVYEEKHKTSNC